MYFSFRPFKRSIIASLNYPKMQTTLKLTIMLVFLQFQQFLNLMSTSVETLMNCNIFQHLKWAQGLNLSDYGDPFSFSSIAIQVSKTCETYDTNTHLCASLVMRAVS